MRAAITMAAALALATIPASGSAQLMGAKELTAQGLVNGAPSSRSAADLYYLAGDVGARENYTLTIKGPARISLFTPDGHEMLSTSGSGKVVLDAVLNFTDVFVPLRFHASIRGKPIRFRAVPQCRPSLRQ